MIELNQDNLIDVVSGDKPVIVQYGAAWCGNCRMIKPKVKKLAEENQNIEFVYVDAEKYPESRKLAKVDNLPTFALFKGGQVVSQNFGNKIEIVQELVNEAANN
ncbi:MAG: thioredoxin family protein [Bdellovibrionales bacterium]